MIIGAHAMLYSTDAAADRAFLRDVLKLAHVDVGGGWLVFALPPSEVAIHPADGAGQELTLMCDDLEAFMAEMRRAGHDCTPPSVQSWGALTNLTLPSGARLGVYQPRHARPDATA